MDPSNKTFSNLVGALKSWIPKWRSEPAHVSRDFWMPDESCRVCYDCDSQFTLFNRRHHCRLCGRIFCFKCTSNWIPTPSNEPNDQLEEWDKIRVCNYCFKQWKQGLATPLDNESHLDFDTTSPSAESFISTKSSVAGDNSSMAFASVPQSVGVSPYPSPRMETNVDRQSFASAMNTTIDVEVGGHNLSQDQLEFFPCRSDDEYEDEDEKIGVSQLSSITSHFSDANGYFGSGQFDDIDYDYNLYKVHSDGNIVSSKSVNSFDSQTPREVQTPREKGIEYDTGDECEAPNSPDAGEVEDTEPVDFENNGVLWLPPEPEDEDDEREEFIFGDENDGDTSGEWGYLQNSSPGQSGEFKTRDKSNEEHKRAIKSAVDGHFRSLVAQLLQVENVPPGEENDKESWLEIITSLSWEAASLLKPDTSKGGQMDPGGYVKVKCLASGRRSQSMVVKGVVCKKNVAHRRMTTRIEKPRLMILGGALEYQRVSNALSSFDTLLQQEMDHLKMAVAKIEVHHPDILLVEKSVSRYAQEYLLAKNISLVLNIKKQLLERIGRCTGAQIVSSIDHMSSQKLGHCDMFHVDKCLEEHGTASQGGRKLVKTLMYFEGCPKPLGCTILVRGANGDELKKVKHVVQYGIFAAYHLALETSFLADEGASLPELPLNVPIMVALPDKHSKIDRSISTIPLTIPDIEKTPGPQFVSGPPLRSMSVPSSDLVELINEHDLAKTNSISASVSSQYNEPRSTFTIGDSFHASEKSYADYFRSSEVKSFDAARLTSTGDPNTRIMRSQFFGNDARRRIPIPPSLQLIGEKVLEGQPTLLPPELPATPSEFPPTPADHQSILVSLSSRCVWKGTVCERSHLLRIKYYGNFDKPLGRFLRDHLFDQNYRCRSCEMPAEAHVQCYTHVQGTLIISVKKLAEILLPGENDGKIWMWHRCLKCPRANGFPPATRRVVMSDAAWGLSFGKFLELSFSNHAAASRVASCGHSLHRDCLRFYGFGNMVACFRYASIDVYSVYLPPPKLNFNYDDNQEWIQKELDEVNFRAELLVSEVLNALHLLVQRKSASSHLVDLEVMLHKEKSEFEESLHKIVNKEAKSGQPTVDILELNRLRRQLVFQSYMWDHRLIYADSLDDKTKADDAEDSSAETIQKPIVDDKASDVPLTKSKILGASGHKKPEKCSIPGLNSEKSSHHHHHHHHHLSGLHQRTSSFFSTDSGNHQNLKATNESDNVESDQGTLRRALSDGQVPFCLSETLDAAWTGGNFLGFGFSNTNNLSDSVDADKLSTAVLSEKLDPEDHKEDLGMSRVSSSHSFLFPISADNMEDTVSWLSMSFISFYKSLNKNFLGSTRKMDTFGEYDPVYISSFRESELQSGARLLLPVGINDTVVPVYDDEPTSIISYALVSPDYLIQLSDEPERQKDVDSIFSMYSLDSVNFQSFASLDEMVLESSRSFSVGDDAMFSFTNSRSSLPLDPLSYAQALHARISFVDDGPLGKVKYTVTCYYAKRFEGLRRMCCPSEVDFIRSLSRCKKWGAQGGKSNVFFAKSMDERFIIKQVTKTELESFIKFAPGYFKYLSESISSRSPTCLAKILGIYQVASKHVKGGKDSKMDLLVMENLLYERNVTRLYDLKGSTRSRYNSDSSGANKVLLDQNLIEAMPTSPIFVGNKAKRLLERAVWNDTAFLASVDVMDYSLLVGVDEEKNELVLGIIDFMRQYTWDKHLETWVKASGILGGPKNTSPTVISPKQYKRRFRKAMTTYFLMVPDQWSPHVILPPTTTTTTTTTTDFPHEEENSNTGFPHEDDDNNNNSDTAPDKT